MGVKSLNLLSPTDQETGQAVFKNLFEGQEFNHGNVTVRWKRSPFLLRGPMQN